MRTPNTKCCICGKPLYRRPGALKRVRYVACMEHRAEAQRQAGLTDAQKAALKLGRPKGTNHLEGIPKSEESNRKRSKSIARWCAENRDKVMERARQTRDLNHYLWNGGSSRLNISIRQMTENRHWVDAIKARDGACVHCGTTEKMESHHVEPLAEMIERLGITSRKDARRHAAELWNLDNGVTLCQPCHYNEHGREYAD